MLKAIVNVNEEWAIGKDGELLCWLPEDMRFFRETTKDSIVVMGRMTLESFPKGAPLKGRINIVLTSDPGHISADAFAAAEADRAAGKATELLTACSIPALFTLLEQLSGTKKEVFVIGGESVYSALLPYCDTCLVTKNDSRRPADSYFPNLDELSDWHLSAEGETGDSDGTHYRFTTYLRVGEPGV